MKKHPHSSFICLILFLVLALLWSASFLAIKISIDFFSPVFAVFLRVAIAFISLSILLVCMRAPLKLPYKTAALLWIQGIISQAIAFLFLFWGEQFIAPALASIINATVPLWVLLINGLVLREKGTFTLKKTLGLIIGFLGIVIIFGPLLLDKNKINSSMPLAGALAIVGMALSYAIGAILYQRLFSKETPIDFKASIWHQHLGSVVFLYFFSLFTHSWPEHTIFSNAAYDAWIGVTYLGIFSTACAWFIYSHLIIQWGAIRTTSVLYVVPIFAILWDRLFLHISIQGHELFGVGAILLGVLCVQIPRRGL